MKGCLLNPRNLHRVCSTSAVAPPPRRGRGHCTRVYAADAMCKDMVNTRTQRTPSEGTATITFLGAEGQEMSVDCSKDQYILDAGLDSGLELPYTCRGGICGACVGRVVEGKVDPSDIADLEFTLSEDEIAQGMALICMSRPASDTVRIETQSDWGYSLGVAEWKGATGHIAGKAVRPLSEDL